MPDATIYDVARLAGVSISTVSLVTNRPDRVSDATRERVLSAIDELRFVPKERAVARARHGVGHIGVLAPFTSYPSYGERLSGVLEEAAAQSYQVAVFDHPSAARTAKFLQTLPVTRRLDGLIVMSVPLEQDVADRLRSGNLPAVLVDVTEPGFTSVSADDVAGGQMAGRAIAAKGHQRVAFVGEEQAAPGFDSPALARLRGLRQGLAEAGVEVADERCLMLAPDISRVRTAVLDLLRSTDRPTAIFAHTDLGAASVLRTASELGLRVPEDLAVVGYDDMDWAEAVGLTTVRQPLRETGRLATRSLLEQIDGSGTPGARTILPVELVQRSTL